MLDYIIHRNVKSVNAYLVKRKILSVNCFEMIAAVFRIQTYRADDNIFRYIVTEIFCGNGPSQRINGFGVKHQPVHIKDDAEKFFVFYLYHSPPQYAMVVISAISDCAVSSREYWQTTSTSLSTSSA